ncbi:MAG: hypothetical protein ABGX83_05220 [Nitrospira sp.]
MSLFKFGHSLVDKMRQLFKEDLPSHVISGMTAPTDAGLTHTIALGVASVDGYRIALAATGHTYTASRDTYVDLSIIGVLTFVEVANLAAEPATTADSVRFLKVVTDGTAITASDRFKGAGILNSGVVVPLGRMQRTEVSSENASLVTVLTGTTSVTTISLGTVNSGDRILVSAAMLGSKGATAGSVTAEVQKSAGTATIETFNDKAILINFVDSVAISGGFDKNIFGIIKVTGTGTLTLALIGRSGGSDLSVLAGNGQIHAIVLNNG